MQQLQSAYSKVLQQVALASTNSKFKKPVQLVAVSKTKSAAEILDVYKQGQRVFGENYVDELVQKVAELPEDINWHFIGHLQSNKVPQLTKLKNLECIQTVDSLKLATKLNKHCLANNRQIQVYIQVKLSEEVTKSGATIEESHLIVQELLTKLTNLQLCGLMTIGPSGDSSVFLQLLQVKEEIQAKHGITDLKLSMGMSGDFIEAIECGADVVRIGSAIFGDRNYNN